MGKIEIRREKCKGCGLCIESCPKGLIDWEKSLNRHGVHPVYFMVRNFKTSGTTENRLKVIGEADFLEGGECTGCTLCAQICPECCIEVFRDV